MLTVVLRGPGSSPGRFPLERTLQAGGTQADDLHLPGEPPGALRLVPRPAGAVVEPSVAGARAGGRPVPAGGRRLLRPGERIELHAFSIALERTQPEESTRAAAASLLRAVAAGMVPPSGAHLVVLTGRDAGALLPLGEEESLGRSRRATLRISDPHASRLHARLRTAAGVVTLEDLSSRNGVRVNGVRVDRPIALRPGDEIAIGQTIFALEVAELARRVAAPPPRRAAAHRVPVPVLAAALLALSAALAFAAS